MFHRLSYTQRVKCSPAEGKKNTEVSGTVCALAVLATAQRKDAEQEEAKSAAQKAFVIARGWTGKRGLGSFAGTEADDERNLSANTTPSRSPRGPRAREKRSQLNEPQRPPSIMH